MYDVRLLYCNLFLRWFHVRVAICRHPCFFATEIGKLRGACDLPRSPSVDSSSSTQLQLQLQSIPRLPQTI